MRPTRLLVVMTIAVALVMIMTATTFLKTNDNDQGAQSRMEGNDYSSTPSAPGGSSSSNAPSDSNSTLIPTPILNATNDDEKYSLLVINTSKQLNDLAETINASARRLDLKTISTQVDKVQTLTLSSLAEIDRLNTTLLDSKRNFTMSLNEYMNATYDGEKAISTYNLNLAYAAQDHYYAGKEYADIAIIELDRDSWKKG